MITVETPLKSLQTQRRGLEVLLITRPDRREYICGALAVLDWIEHGAESPLEGLSATVAQAIAEDTP